MRIKRKPRLYLVVSEVELLGGPILGAFQTDAEATAFVDEIEDRFEKNTLLIVQYDAGWRYDGGTARYRANFPEKF